MKELTNINFRRYKWRLPALIAEYGSVPFRV